MDPSPSSFPLLSYVLTRINSNISNIPLLGRVSSSVSSTVDIEQPQHHDRAEEQRHEQQLFEQMPYLRDPEVLAAMTAAVTDVAQTRSVLRKLGDRPDHEAVDAARQAIAEIDAGLSKQLQEIVLAPPPEGVDTVDWRLQQGERERECRAAADKEKGVYKAVVHQDEMHSAYEELLREAEKNLVRIYRSAQGVVEPEEEPAAAEEVNEEVVGVLQDAMGKGVERIDLSGRQLRSLPEAFGRLGGLMALDLSNNQLQRLLDSIGALENLEELRLASNHLLLLPDSIGLLLNLKILDVSGNQLTALPDSISHCRSLVELDASYNKLTYLPTNIGYKLVSLRKLSVHLNKLRSLPTSICEMKSLQHLDAHFNQLRGLPHAIGKLTNLVTLNLASNFSDLKELPSTIGDLINLVELDLSNNQIQSLPITFGQLHKLAKLNLDENPLVFPSKEVVDCGVQAVKECMTKRQLDALMGGEHRSMFEANNASSQMGWLTRSTSWLNNFVNGVSDSVSGYSRAPGGRSFKDSYLDQEL